jgi:3-oxoacyl-[acyl-carrier protein] reductase
VRDRYLELTESAPGRLLANQLGAPRPVRLRRHMPGAAVLDGPALIGGAPGGRLGEAITHALESAGVEILREAPEDEPVDGIIYDATGIGTPEGLHHLYAFLHPVVRQLAANGRLIILGTAPEETDTVGEAVANEVLVSKGAEGSLESTLRFLLSGRSAYVDAQVVRVGPGEAPPPEDWKHPLRGRVALVTGASRGIGESVACTLARDGAHVVCLDVPAQGEQLAAVANRIDGTALQLDITDDDAPERLAAYAQERHGAFDVVVHNAGVTRDRTLGRMSEDEWDVLMAINLVAPQKLTEALLDAGALAEGGRVVLMSSMNGIAGQRGQTNYATSKAGLIGLAQALAPRLVERQATINAVAPGFIETQMTSAMPLLTREAGRRMNTLAQGGQPVDVAETVAWMAQRASGGVTGNVVRVCGQSLLGA